MTKFDMSETEALQKRIERLERYLPDGHEHLEALREKRDKASVDSGVIPIETSSSDDEVEVLHSWSGKFDAGVDVEALSDEGEALLTRIRLLERYVSDDDEHLQQLKTEYEHAKKWDHSGGIPVYKG